MLQPVMLVILAVAVARMCVLMVGDTITQPWRDWVKRKLGPEHMLTQGAHCNWCWSIWFSYPMTALTFLAFNPSAPVWAWIVTPLAVSFAASYLADKVT